MERSHVWLTGDSKLADRALSRLNLRGFAEEGGLEMADRLRLTSTQQDRPAARNGLSRWRAGLVAARP